MAEANKNEGAAQAPSSSKAAPKAKKFFLFIAVVANMVGGKLYHAGDTEVFPEDYAFPAIKKGQPAKWKKLREIEMKAADQFDPAVEKELATLVAEKGLADELLAGLYRAVGANGSREKLEAVKAFVAR